MADDENDYKLIITKVRDETGFDLGQYRESYIKRFTSYPTAVAHGTSGDSDRFCHRSEKAKEKA